MSDLKLRKLIEHTARLKEQLDMPRIKVSEASETYASFIFLSFFYRLIKYVTSTKDPLLPTVWGPVDKKDDPFVSTGGGCCVVS